MHTSKASDPFTLSNNSATLDLCAQNEIQIYTLFGPSHIQFPNSNNQSESGIFEQSDTGIFEQRIKLH